MKCLFDDCYHLGASSAIHCTIFLLLKRTVLPKRETVPRVWSVITAKINTWYYPIKTCSFAIAFRYLAFGTCSLVIEFWYLAIGTCSFLMSSGFLLLNPAFLLTCYCILLFCSCILTFCYWNITTCTFVISSWHFAIENCFSVIALWHFAIRTLRPTPLLLCSSTLMLSISLWCFDKVTCSSAWHSVTQF